MSDARRETDRDAADLDDELDRDELRQRYYGLLQELRVVVPGVQVLVAFLLTAPFAARFAELDDLQRRAFGVAMMSGMLSVTAYIAPMAFHRVGERKVRATRLKWSIRCTLVGLAALAVALLSALFVVSDLTFGLAPAVAFTIVAGLAMALLWLVFPLSQRRGRHPRP